MRRLSPTVMWVISIFLTLFFVAQGFSKLLGSSAAQWGSRFVTWGYPAGFHYVVGAIEIIGGVALLLPWSRKAGAGSLTVVMAGASCTHLIHGELLRVIAPLSLGTLAVLLFFFAGIKEPRSTS